MTYTEEQLSAAFEKLPEDIQAAIADAETEKRVNEIGQSHGLHLDQIGKLADETGLVMLGLKRYDEFADNLAKSLGISSNEAQLIAGEINWGIFSGIREAVKQTADGLTSNNQGAQNDFGQITRIFSAAAPEAPAPRVWEQDPYLADPSKM